LEAVVPKDRILDLYLNLAEWGDGYFGAEAAAQHWFKTSARRLTDDQAARLAAILPAPRRWTPTGAVATRRTGFIRPRMQQVTAYEP
jgi:monofunctional biosynthetic peptidoglycan transglycosylase